MLKRQKSIRRQKLKRKNRKSKKIEKVETGPKRQVEKDRSK